MTQQPSSTPDRRSRFENWLETGRPWRWLGGSEHELDAGRRPPRHVVRACRIFYAIGALSFFVMPGVVLNVRYDSVGAAPPRATVVVYSTFIVVAGVYVAIGMMLRRRAVWGYWLAVVAATLSFVVPLAITLQSARWIGLWVIIPIVLLRYLLAEDTRRWVHRARDGLAGVDERQAQRARRAIAADGPDLAAITSRLDRRKSR